MITLRPHHVLDNVTNGDRFVHIILPNQKSLTSMLEKAIIVALLKIIKPTKVFEFGTSIGETTLMLAANSNALVYTIDINNELMETMGKLDEREINNANSRICEELIFSSTQYENNIHTIISDSTTYDFSKFSEDMDFILIDGGHHIDVVKSDTNNAFKMLSLQRPSCIIWHDYGNPYYQITDFLDDLAKDMKLYHVAETGYVFYVSNIDTFAEYD
ncbi:MAG: class I SAM-dependent methyltransferase [Syntrophomonas sp.]